MTETHTLAGTPATTGASTPGAFVWHEYVANDTRGARRFYSELLGWNIKSHPMGDGPDYPEIYVGETPIGGFYQCDASMGDIPAHWFGYVSVPNVDEAAAKAVAAGGRIMVEAKDIPSVGRFATLMDPQGAVFAVFRSTFGDPAPDARPAIGEFCWDSLGTTDTAAAPKFYAEVVGWRAGEEASGAGSVFFSGDKMEASFDPAPAGVPAHWLPHVVVESLVEARAKVESLGGKVLMAQVDIPFGSFAVVQDPFGAVLSLFEGKQG